MQVCTLLQTDNHASTLPLTRVSPDKGLLNVCLCSGTTWVSRYQKNNTNLDFTEARDSDWQRHQLGHMQVCTLVHGSTPPLSFYSLGAFPAGQLTVSKSTEGNNNITVQELFVHQ